MKKQVVFSFDDARADTYTNAYPILEKYGFSFTLNVTSDFVLHPKQYHCFTSSNNMSMTVEQLIECQKNGIEIACHGHTHQNTATDVLDNIAAMEKRKKDITENLQNNSNTYNTRLAKCLEEKEEIMHLITEHMGEDV